MQTLSSTNNQLKTHSSSQNFSKTFKKLIQKEKITHIHNVKIPYTPIFILPKEDKKSHHCSTEENPNAQEKQAENQNFSQEKAFETINDTNENQTSTPEILMEETNNHEKITQTIAEKISNSSKLEAKNPSKNSESQNMAENSIWQKIFE